MENLIYYSVRTKDGVVSLYSYSEKTEEHTLIKSDLGETDVYPRPIENEIESLELSGGDSSGRDTSVVKTGGKQNPNRYPSAEGCLFYLSDNKMAVKQEICADERILRNFASFARTSSEIYSLQCIGGYVFYVVDIDIPRKDIVPAVLKQILYVQDPWEARPGALHTFNGYARKRDEAPKDIPQGEEPPTKFVISACVTPKLFAVILEEDGDRYLDFYLYNKNVPRLLKRYKGFSGKLLAAGNNIIATQTDASGDVHSFLFSPYPKRLMPFCDGEVDGVYYRGELLEVEPFLKKKPIAPKQLTHEDARRLVNRQGAHIEIPHGYTAIGERAFYGCSISSVFLPEGINVIGDEAFMNCENLYHVNMPKSLREIKDRAFMNCYNLAPIELPDKLAAIRRSVFAGCSRFETVLIPGGVGVLLEGAFDIYTKDPEGKSNFKSFSVAESNPNCISVDGVLFTKSMKTLIAYPSGKEDESYTVPKKVEAIFGGAFNSCHNIRELILTNGVLDLQDALSCRNLEALVLPDTLHKIDPMLSLPPDVKIYCDSKGSAAYKFFTNKGYDVITSKEIEDPALKERYFGN